MHLKQKGYCFGVILVHTINIITLPSVGWCEQTASSSQTSSPPALNEDMSRLLTTGGLTRHPYNRGGGGMKRLRLHSTQGEESRNLLNIHYLENRDGTQMYGRTPERTPKNNMASSSTTPDKRFKNRDKPKRTKGRWMYSSLNPPNEDCSKGEIKPVIPGKFYITGQLNTNTPNMGYQSDDAVSGQERIRGQRLSGSEESWQRLQPVVECGDDAMTLTVRRRRAVQLLLDRANESSVPLSQLPPQCGYSVQTTWRDLSLMAQYNACHVTQEGDSFVLPLLWRGTPVKMSCPASQIQSEAEGPHSSASLCCSADGMTVRVQGLSATDELRVKVRGEWTPLTVLAEQCGYTLGRQDAEIVISAPFITCGITVVGEKYTLALQIGQKTFALTCHVSPPEDIVPTHQPHLPRGPAEHLPVSLEPFPWAPPFYLAPPYYPHPTYHHKYPTPNGHDPYEPTTSSSSTPDPTFGPLHLPSVDSHPDYREYYSQHSPFIESYKHFGVHSSLSSTEGMEDSSLVYPDLQQNQETSVLGLPEKRSAAHSPSSDTGFPMQIETPSLQPPTHPFNQYYHYYHHPKIPLPFPPQDSDPGPEISSSNNPHDPEFPVLPRSFRQPEALRFTTDHLFQPFASHPSAPFPPELYPYHYFSYFPHFAQGEAKRLAPLNPDTASKTNVPDQSTQSSTFAHPRFHSSEVYNEHNTDQPNSDKMIQIQRKSHETLKHPHLSDADGVKAEQEPPVPDTVADPPPEQPHHHLPPYPYYHNPYYHYYQMYFRPENVLRCNNHVSPTSPKEALDLFESSPVTQHPSHRSPRTPNNKSMDDVPHDPMHPYYYLYHHYYQPKVSVHNQEVLPAASINLKSDSQLPSHSDNSQTGWLAHTAEAENPSMPQSSPIHSLYSHDVTQVHLYEPVGHPEEAEEVLDDEMRDRPQANPNTPSASPCGLGPVTHFDCSVASGCCSHPLNDYKTGVVLEPTVAPAAHPSEVRNVSCTLQWLTSDPDIYVVPLDACGANKHVFGQAGVHLLEVHDLQSVHENSPVRLMVECSTSPTSPGEVRLHVMDQPPPPPVQSTPATVTVQLRIATDESFTSFHPEAHLPLSVMRGRLVYVEVSLLDPPEPDLVLLVHSCLAYTRAPYTSWMLVYDGCPSHADSQLLLSPHSHHIRWIMISSFLSLSSESSTYKANGEHTHLEDPEIFFLCLTEVCLAVDGDCTMSCIDSPSSEA